MMSTRKGLNSLQLWEALTQNTSTQPFFDGVYALDQLKHIKSKPKLVLSNTDPQYKAGKHWLLFFFNEDGMTMDFFDSLGRNPEDYPHPIPEFIRKWSSEVYYMPNRVQPEGSALCGHYCLYYAYSKSLGESMEDILSHMPSSEWIEKCILILFKINKIRSTCQTCECN